MIRNTKAELVRCKLSYFIFHKEQFHQTGFKRDKREREKKKKKEKKEKKKKKKKRKKARKRKEERKVNNV